MRMGREDSQNESKGMETIPSLKDWESSIRVKRDVIIE